MAKLNIKITAIKQFNELRNKFVVIRSDNRPWISRFEYKARTRGSLWRSPLQCDPTKYDVTPKFLPPNNCNPVLGSDRTAMVIGSHHWARWRGFQHLEMTKDTDAKCQKRSRDRKQNLDIPIWKRINWSNQVLLLLQFYRWQIHRISLQNGRFPLNLIVDGIGLSFVETELCNLEIITFYLRLYLF